MDVSEIIADLRQLATPEHYAKLKHFGIEDKNALGVKIPDLRKYAKELGKNHELALELWETGIHEVRIMASYIADPKQLTEAQAERWIRSFDSWDVCDQTCDVIGKTDFAQKLIENYSAENKEFVKRTAFVLMCTLAVHDKKLPNELFISYLDIIEREAWDERNFVRKAVNWALRQIGKRNPVLRESAIETGERIKAQGTKSAKWIAGDALRELHDGKIIARINSKVK